MSKSTAPMPHYTAPTAQGRNPELPVAHLPSALNSARSLPLRYGVALVSTALVVLLRELLTPVWGNKLPFLTLYPAVLVSAWYGGLGPGLVTTALCATAAAYFWLAPLHSLAVSDSVDQIGLALAMLVMLLITWLTAARQRSEDALRRAHEELEQRVQERTAELVQANAALQAEIMERQRAEEALRMPALVLEHMAEGVALVDAESNEIVFTGPAFDTMCGYAHGELLGQNGTVLNAYTPEENSRLLQALRDAAHTSGVWTGEISNRKKDGTPFISFAHTVLFEREGKRYWVNVQQDITARKQAEVKRAQLLAQLESERARLTTTLEQLPVGVIIADAASEDIILANTHAKQIWRHERLSTSAYAPEFARYQGFFPDGRPYQIEDWPLQRALRTGETTTEEEIAFIRGDSARGVMQVSAAPIREADGRATAAVVTILDITARKQMEEELRRLNDELDQRVQERTAALHESEAKLAVELADTTQLQQISSQLLQEENINALYEQILNAAITLLRAEMGSMQMLYPEKNHLRLLAWRGFAPASAEFWEWVRVDSGSTCGVALATGERVMAPDVETCEFMAGTDDLDFYRLSGVRAVQSTPLVSRSGPSSA